MSEEDLEYYKALAKENHLVTPTTVLTYVKKLEERVKVQELIIKNQVDKEDRTWTIN